MFHPAGHRSPWLPAWWLAAALCAACAPMLESTVDKVDKDAPVTGDDLFVSPDFAKHAPRVVALLPLVNETEDPEAPEILRRLVYGNFSALPFQDVELSRLDAALDADPSADPVALAKGLGADGVLKGRVVRFERNYYGVYADLQAEVDLELISVTTGERLWRGRADEERRNVSLSLSAVGLAVGMVSNAMEISRLALIRTANDACRRVVHSIPVPGKLGSRPEIFELAHNGLGRTLKAGDRVEVALEGSPGLSGHFSLPGVRDEVPLREDPDHPGRYLGSLALPDKLEQAGIVLEATLSNDRGETVRWVDPTGALTVDTLPPAPVAGLAGEGGDGTASLSWTEGTERDLARFLVLRSDSPLQGYRTVAEVQVPTFTDHGLENDRPYYYKVAAVDAAGNQGEPSSRIEARPVAPGPRTVRGRLGVGTTWPRAGGPYVLEGEVEVPRGATLTVEPGTVIQAGPGSILRVRGSMQAEGTDAQRISLLPATEGQAWRGLVVEGPGGEPSHLSHVRIEGAEVGVHVVDASPQLDRVRVSECGVGIRVEGVESTPQLTGALVYANRGAGLELRRSAAPTVTYSRILQNDGLGVRVEDAGGTFYRDEISDNRGGGIQGRSPSLRLGYNRITGNGPFEVNLGGVERGFPLVDLNYWGPPETVEAATSVVTPRGTVRVLQTPNPDGEALDVPLLQESVPDGMETGFWVRRRTYLVSVTESTRDRPPFVEGIEALDSGDFAAAVTALEAATAADPNDPEAQFWLGNAHLALGQAEPAIQALERACLLNVRSPEYRLRLADAYRAAGRLADAELVYREVLRLDPGNAEAKGALETLPLKASAARPE